MRRALLVLSLLLAGCSVGGDDGEGSVQPGQLPGLVLQPDDVSRAFQRFDEGSQAIADNPGGSRADPARFGRQEGWKARYRRVATAQTAGPLVIESRVDLFESTSGAEDELDAAQRDIQEGELEWDPISEPGLGDESFAATLVQPGTGSGVRYYRVYWRDANVSGSISVSGFEGRFSLAEALALARKQQEHIDGAVGSSG